MRALLILFLLSGPVAAQMRGVITGEVTDRATGEPLPGVNVVLEGTLLGASTALDGSFLIRSVPPGTYTLRASMMGYRVGYVYNLKVAAGETTRVSFRLEQTVVELNPIVVTASKRHEELISSPNSIAVVPAAEVVTRNCLRLDEALEAVPGVHFIENHINIRGSSGYTRGVGSRVLLLVDGVPTMISDTNEINWNLLPVMEVERIEVVKGCGSALYGSNALGGVINLITKPPTTRGKLLLRIAAGVYDKPYYDRWRWTDRLLHYDRMDISYSRSFGPLGMRLYFGKHQSTGYRQDGHFQRWNASGRFDWRFWNGSKLTLYSAWSYEKRGEFVEWENQNQALKQSYWFSKPPRRVRLNIVDLYVQYWGVLSPKAALKLRASSINSLFGDQYRRKEDYSPARGFGAEVQGDWIPHPAHTITFGVEFKLDGGKTKHIGDHKGYTIAPYLQDEWRLRRNLRVTCGVRYDRYKLLDGYAESHWSPRIGVNYKPFEGTTLRASGGSAFRAASVTERFINTHVSYFDLVPNENLKPEVSWSFDLGIRQQLTRDWYLDVGLFHSDFWDLIEPYAELQPNMRYKLQFRNLIRARIRGLEFSTGGRWWHNRLGLQASLTWMDPEDLNTGKTLAYRPKLLAWLTPSIRLGPFELQADYRYASRIEEVGIYPKDERVPQKVLDLRLIYRLGSFNFIAAVNNALQYNYTQLERNLCEIRNFAISMTASL